MKRVALFVVVALILHLQSPCYCNPIESPAIEEKQEDV